MWYCVSDIIFHINLCGDNKKTDTLIAPYRENYVHRILFFYVRISLTSNDQGPAGPDPDGPDGAGPIMVKIMVKPPVCEAASLLQCSIADEEDCNIV